MHVVIVDEDGKRTPQLFSSYATASKQAYANEKAEKVTFVTSDPHDNGIILFFFCKLLNDDRFLNVVATSPLSPTICYFVTDGQAVPTLCELSARCVASHIPFELVEHFYPPVPEQLQLRIAFWSFPDNEEDIRLYSCLANGSADEFLRGEHLFRAKTVKEPLQIGKTPHIRITLTRIFCIAKKGVLWNFVSFLIFHELLILENI